MKDIIGALDAGEAALQSRVEAHLRNEDVTWDYTHVTGNVPSQLIAYAALADVIVTGRHPHTSDFAGPTVGLLGELLQHSRTPLFIPGNGSMPMDVTGVALIAWNGSYEAANAVRTSLGLLRLASEVRILYVDEQGETAFPSTRLLEYLSRQGIHAELRLEAAPPGRPDASFVAGSLIAHALGVNAAYVVLGGYSHSRVSEYLFGGVTRALLGDCPVPLLVAH
jgi:nucleotide-binding universal stress UspA family protein